jgi:hypothetical protein
MLIGNQVTDYYDMIKQPMGKTSFTFVYVPVSSFIVHRESTRARRKRENEIILIETIQIDLATMSRKLEANTYTVLDEFLSDARLIFSNCRSYNDAGSNCQFPFFFLTFRRTSLRIELNMVKDDELLMRLHDIVTTDVKFANKLEGFMDEQVSSFVSLLISHPLSHSFFPLHVWLMID